MVCFSPERFCVLKMHRHCYDVAEIKGKSISRSSVKYLKCVQFHNWLVVRPSRFGAANVTGAINATGLTSRKIIAYKISK